MQTTSQQFKRLSEEFERQRMDLNADREATLKAMEKARTTLQEAESRADLAAEQLRSTPWQEFKRRFMAIFTDSQNTKDAKTDPTPVAPQSPPPGPTWSEEVGGPGHMVPPGPPPVQAEPGTSKP